MSAVLVASLWRKFICRACGLIYDEAEGDIDSGLAAGTRWEDIADDWACPLCGVTKADFEPYDDSPVERRATRSHGAVNGARQGRADAGVVIVGAGRAGWQMAAALRERDADVPITLVSACDASVYDKPQLSVVQARGLSQDALVKETGSDAAARLGVRLLANTDAVRIDATSRQLRTTRATLRYRHLVLAHGAEPRAVERLPQSLCWRINHLDVYRRFRDALGAPVPESSAGVLIVGAGLVGCELANDLALAGHRVTLLDVEERPLAALLDADRSAALLAAWRDLPLHFEGGARVREVARDTSVAADAATTRIVVACEDGRRFVAAHVVAATGLATCPRLAASAGLDWNNGIAVDAVTLATNLATIHALGDCISIDGQAHRYIEPIARQARIVADRILGRSASPYLAARPPIRIKTSSLPFTV